MIYRPEVFMMNLVSSQDLCTNDCRFCLIFRKSGVRSKGQSKLEAEMKAEGGFLCYVSNADIREGKYPRKIDCTTYLGGNKSNIYLHLKFQDKYREKPRSIVEYSW